MFVLYIAMIKTDSDKNRYYNAYHGLRLWQAGCGMEGCYIFVNV